MIDEAPAGTHFYRITLDPDPTREDGKKDLDLRDVTEHTIRRLAEMVEGPVYYVAAVHADHAPHRHVYVLASVQRRLNTPELKHLRDTATLVCREQRQELDVLLEQQTRERVQEDSAREPEWEEDVWAS